MLSMSSLWVCDVYCTAIPSPWGIPISGLLALPLVDFTAWVLHLISAQAPQHFTGSAWPSDSSQRLCLCGAFVCVFVMCVHMCVCVCMCVCARARINQCPFNCVSDAVSTTTLSPVDTTDSAVDFNASEYTIVILPLQNVQTLKFILC